MSIDRKAGDVPEVPRKKPRIHRTGEILGSCSAFSAGFRQKYPIFRVYDFGHMLPYFT